MNGTFLGCSNQYKGYKILLPTEENIFSIDVIFYESKFPYQKESVSEIVSQGQPSSSIPLPPLILNSKKKNHKPDEIHKPLPDICTPHNFSSRNSTATKPNSSDRTSYSTISLFLTYSLVPTEHHLIMYLINTL